MYMQLPTGSSGYLSDFTFLNITASQESLSGSYAYNYLGSLSPASNITGFVFENVVIGGQCWANVSTAKFLLEAVPPPQFYCGVLPSSSPTSSPQPASNLPVGAIAGGSAGGVVVVLILTIVLWKVRCGASHNKPVQTLVVTNPLPAPLHTN